MDYKKIFAKRKILENKLLELNPELNNQSGIYWFVRYENGFKYAYIGQAKHILDRLISHLLGNQQHIDLSIKKHKFWSNNNITGWQIYFKNYPENLLNQKEQEYILDFANQGYQLRNKTSGSQSNDKFGIAENKSSKGYRDGIQQGKIAILKEIKCFFDKYLDYSIKGKENKLKQRKLDEFKKLLGD